MEDITDITDITEVKQILKTAKAVSRRTVIEYFAVTRDGLSPLKELGISDLINGEHGYTLKFKMTVYSPLGEKFVLKFEDENARFMHSVWTTAFSCNSNRVLAVKVNRTHDYKVSVYAAREKEDLQYFTELQPPGNMSVEELPYPAKEDAAIEYADLWFSVQTRLSAWVDHPNIANVSRFLHHRSPHFIPITPPRDEAKQGVKRKILF